jgi:hypothetical protein
MLTPLFRFKPVWKWYQVAEELPLVVDDRRACRQAMLRALQANVSRTDFILKGCKNLGITVGDEEMVQAALQAGTRTKAPLYYDLWCGGVIGTFAAHPEVRKIALEELMRRDGSVGVVAGSYPADEDMCRRVRRSLPSRREGAHAAGPRYRSGRTLE